MHFLSEASEPAFRAAALRHEEESEAASPVTPSSPRAAAPPISDAGDLSQVALPPIAGARYRKQAATSADALASLRLWDETEPVCISAAIAPTSSAAPAASALPAVESNRIAELPATAMYGFGGATHPTHSHYRRLQAAVSAGLIPSATAAAAEATTPDTAACLATCFLRAAAAQKNGTTMVCASPPPPPLTSSAAGGPSHSPPAPQLATIADPRSCFRPLHDAYRRRLRRELSDATRSVAADENLAHKKTATKDRAMLAMRQAVSQNKVRFQEDGFDLDLTYITPRVIAMGFPSSGRESYYRNPMPEVERFFERRHPKHFRVYNLCSERDYDAPSRFGGSFKRFPFDDHNAPHDLSLIPAFVEDAQLFLKQDEENVVAVHCKAGKGRTGLMVSCLLMVQDTALRQPDAALQFFGDLRTNDSQGVTIPSQIRYVRYWATVLERYGGRVPPKTRTVHFSRLVVHSMVRPKTTSPPDLYFIVTVGRETVFDSRKNAALSSAVKLFDPMRQAYVFDFLGGAESQGLSDELIADQCATNMALAPRHVDLGVEGDVLVTVYLKNKVMSDESLFHFWFNTTLCEYPKLHLTKSELDGPAKDRKHRDYTTDLAITLVLEAPTYNAERHAAAQQQQQHQGSSGSNSPGAAAGGGGATAANSSRGDARRSGFFARVFGSGGKDQHPSST